MKRFVVAFCVETEGVIFRNRTQSLYEYLRFNIQQTSTASAALPCTRCSPHLSRAPATTGLLRGGGRITFGVGKDLGLGEGRAGGWGKVHSAFGGYREQVGSRHSSVFVSCTTWDLQVSQPQLASEAQGDEEVLEGMSRWAWVRRQTLTRKSEAGDMARQLRAHAALADALSFSPSTHIGLFTVVWDFFSRRSNQHAPLPLGLPACTWCTHTHTCRLIFIHIK